MSARHRAPLASMDVPTLKVTEPKGILDVRCGSTIEGKNVAGVMETTMSSTENDNSYISRATIVFGVLVVLGILSICSGYFWSGGMAEGEYQFTIVDGRGEPLSGIEMRVEEDGRDVTHFVVKEPKRPVSDEKGILTFRNWQQRYGGHCIRLFFIIPIGKCNEPNIECCFLHNGRVVQRLSFNDLFFEARDAARPADEQIGKGNFKQKDLQLKKTLVIQGAD